MKNIPPAAADLIADLDGLYPPKCSGPEESLESAQRYAGKRELIDYLRELQAVTERRATRQALGGV